VPAWASPQSVCQKYYASDGLELLDIGVSFAYGFIPRPRPSRMGGARRLPAPHGRRALLFDRRRRHDAARGTRVPEIPARPSALASPDQRSTPFDRVSIRSSVKDSHACQQTNTDQSLVRPTLRSELVGRQCAGTVPNLHDTTELYLLWNSAGTWIARPPTTVPVRPADLHLGLAPLPHVTAGTPVGWTGRPVTARVDHVVRRCKEEGVLS
jgi:hypothetical protein